MHLLNKFQQLVRLDSQNFQWTKATFFEDMGFLSKEFKRKFSKLNDDQLFKKIRNEYLGWDWW